ncbi:MAG: DUF4097 domain-containing protein [Balneolales bacterium]|nr:DUF4097 domain-containing protein [Balneolales bacterium]
MKKIIILTFCLIIVSLASTEIKAQPRVVEETLSAGLNERIELDLKFGNSILVTAWDRPELMFRATAKLNNGKLNDAFRIDIQQDGKIRIEMSINSEKVKEGRAEDCAENTYSYTYGYGGIYFCSEISYEIYLPRDADVKIETISANIELAGLFGPVSVKTISGFVDMSWMERGDAELLVKTTTGEVYSNLEHLTYPDKQIQRPYGTDIRAIIGSGGPVVRLETISGDIFLRKRS